METKEVTLKNTKVNLKILSTEKIFDVEMVSSKVELLKKSLALVSSDRFHNLSEIQTGIDLDMKKSYFLIEAEDNERYFLGGFVKDQNIPVLNAFLGGLLESHFLSIYNMSEDFFESYTYNKFNHKNDNDLLLYQAIMGYISIKNYFVEKRVLLRDRSVNLVNHLEARQQELNELYLLESMSQKKELSIPISILQNACRIIFPNLETFLQGNISNKKTSDSFIYLH